MIRHDIFDKRKLHLNAMLWIISLKYHYFQAAYTSFEIIKTATDLRRYLPKECNITHMLMQLNYLSSSCARDPVQLCG
jgi:hypothetical protein